MKNIIPTDTRDTELLIRVRTNSDALDVVNVTVMGPHKISESAEVVSVCQVARLEQYRLLLLQQSVRECELIYGEGRAGWATMKRALDRLIIRASISENRTVMV